MTKIDIVSGFLGAGKTTLIKKLLAEAFPGEKLVLIENEFGEISIDGGFLKESGVQISEMSAGCICCSLVGDFHKALKDVQAQFHPDRILIEPSGVGKLSDVIVAVQNTADETDDMKLNSFVTVADATKVKVYMKNFGEFYNNQIEAAGTIILSRPPGTSWTARPSWRPLKRCPWRTSCWGRCAPSTPPMRRSTSMRITTMTTSMRMRSTNTITIMTITTTRSMTTITITMNTRITMTTSATIPTAPATTITTTPTRCSPPGAKRPPRCLPRRTLSGSSRPWTPATTARSCGPRAS